MPLSDYIPETFDVIYKGKTLVTVRGLNLEDLGVLARNHIPELREMYRRFDPASTGSNFLSSDIDAMIFSLIAEAPGTAAKMIAIASDEPGSVEQAKRLPAPLQLKILIEVARLTVEDVGGPLAFGALLRQLMQRQPTSTDSAHPTIQ